MSNETKHLNHSTWDCKYHVVFMPKYRKKSLYGMICRDLKDVFHRLAMQKESVIKEGRLMPDHVNSLQALRQGLRSTQLLALSSAKNG